MAHPQVKPAHRPENYEQRSAFLGVKSPKATPGKVGPHTAEQRTDYSKQRTESKRSIQQGIKRRALRVFGRRECRSIPNQNQVRHHSRKDHPGKAKRNGKNVYRKEYRGIERCGNRLE